MLDAALLHNSIGGVAGFNFAIYRNFAVSYGAVPNIVVAFTAPHKNASVFF